MAPTIDTESAKLLLQSTNVSELQSAAMEWSEYCSNITGTNDYNKDEHQQILKLRILLNSRIVQLCPKDDNITLSKAYGDMGSIWLDLGDTVRAFGQLTKSLEYDKENVQSLISISTAYKQTNDFENAILNIERSIEMQETAGIDSESTPGICLSYIKLAELYECKADFNQAIAILQKAVELLRKQCDEGSTDSNVVKARALLYSQLGSVQEKIGEYKDAVTSLTTAVTALNQCYGENHPKTQEVAYLLEMASSFV